METRGQRALYQHHLGNQGRPVNPHLQTQHPNPQPKSVVNTLDLKDGLYVCLYVSLIVF